MTMEIERVDPSSQIDTSAQLAVSEIPSLFPDLSHEEWGRLNGLLYKHLDHTRIACVSLLFDAIKGKRGKVSKNIDQLKEITTLSGLTDYESTAEVLGSAALISLGCKSPQETLEEINKDYLEGTEGGQSTGDENQDQQIHNIVRLCALATLIIWEKKRGKVTVNLPKSRERR